MESKEDDAPNAAKAPERRVKKDAAPASTERRTAPKYNVVSKKETATE
jgi:hypothetical protein